MTATAPPLKTMVEDYIQAALDHSVVAHDGDYVEAYVEGIPGVRATGDDRHQCYRNLWDLADEWVRVALALGRSLPPLGGIDLNADRDLLIASYHDSLESQRRMHESREVYETDKEFLEALDRIPHEPVGDQGSS